MTDKKDIDYRIKELAMKMDYERGKTDINDILENVYLVLKKYKIEEKE